MHSWFLFLHKNIISHAGLVSGGKYRTTNLIESYNSHLEGRLKTIKGFESFAHADLWLNGYFLKRRMQPFTDCTKQFAKLNGTASLQHSVHHPNAFDHVSKLLKKRPF